MKTKREYKLLFERTYSRYLNIKASSLVEAIDKSKEDRDDFTGYQLSDKGIYNMSETKEEGEQR